MLFCLCSILIACLIVSCFNTQNVDVYIKIHRPGNANNIPLKTSHGPNLCFSSTVSDHAPIIYANKSISIAINENKLYFISFLTKNTSYNVGVNE